MVGDLSGAIDGISDAINCVIRKIWLCASSMYATDLFVICAIESAIFLFALYAAFCDNRIRRNERHSVAVAKVFRGEKSMTALYAMYGASVASMLVLIDNASGIDGNKVALIVLNFICITYIFFFSTWFRNSIFFPLNQRIRKD
jgi:hypothetical protein